MKKLFAWKYCEFRAKRIVPLVLLAEFVYFCDRHSLVICPDGDQSW